VLDDRSDDDVCADEDSERGGHFAISSAHRCGNRRSQANSGKVGSVAVYSTHSRRRVRGRDATGLLRFLSAAVAVSAWSSTR
jgi:hypothetical protein